MNTCSHSVTRRVRFQHCDPAGIVFYPRYFELLEEIIGTWLAGLTDAGNEARLLGELHQAPRFEHIDCRFIRPSLLGEHIKYQLTPRVVEHQRLTLDFRVRCGEEDRLTGTATLRWYRFAPAPVAMALPVTLRRKINATTHDQTHQYHD